jgi:hypothetical protein
MKNNILWTTRASANASLMKIETTSAVGFLIIMIMRRSRQPHEISFQRAMNATMNQVIAMRQAIVLVRQIWRQGTDFVNGGII